MATSWLPKQVGFWGIGPILLVMILAEAILSLLHTLAWAFRARSTRARIRRLMTKRASRPGVAPAALLGHLALASFLALAGCQNTEKETTSLNKFYKGRPFIGTTFNEQVEHLEWSVYETFLWETPQENFEVMKQDIMVLADPEWGQMEQTFLMWGW